MATGKFARAAKTFDHSNIEYADIFQFKLSPLRPQRLRGELSETFGFFVVDCPGYVFAAILLSTG